MSKARITTPQAANKWGSDVRYFVQVHGGNMAKNKLQQAVDESLRDYQDLTIQSYPDLDQDISHLVDHLNEQHNRCKPLTISTGTGFGGEQFIYINADQGTLRTISVTPIKGHLTFIES